MKRFDAKGNPFENKFDLSPDERTWIKKVRKLSNNVLNCEADPIETIMVFFQDIELIYENDPMDLDKAAQRERTFLEMPEAISNPSSHINEVEQEFWWGIANLCHDVLLQKADFLTLWEVLVHDISFIAGDDGYFWRAIARNFSPKLSGWGTEKNWDQIPN